MGVISIRLNSEEERILKQLSEHFHEEKSALIKKSLAELYENILDLDCIATYEKKEQKKKVSFTTADDILRS
jgi:predicted transcriptional regulator